MPLPSLKKNFFLKSSTYFLKNTELLEGCGASTLAQGHSLSSMYLELEINFCEITHVTTERAHVSMHTTECYGRSQTLQVGGA